MDATSKFKKPWFKRVWVWIGIIVLIGIVASAASPKETPSSDNTSTPETKTTETPKEEPAKWDMEAAYAKIENGMTKAQVEEVTGKKSESCSESQNEYIGKTEMCTYGNAFIDKGAIMITYSNDAVSNKSKHNY